MSVYNKPSWIDPQLFHDLATQDNMCPSSSGSWSGSRGADIIDLDRYMRGAVRPSRAVTVAPSEQQDTGFVVDAGGAHKTLVREHARSKPYSHDSGVSDSSYSRQRKHHKNLLRRSSHAEGDRPRRMRNHNSTTAAANSSSSLRAFRAACEQALLNQQRQIAHVAQLCEQLTRAQGEPPSRPRPRPPSNDTSDMSSSSPSSQDLHRKDRHRIEECKTYKIIMTKLDELNRLFSAREARCPRSSTSSVSVSVCDKLVATDPERGVDTLLYNRSIKSLYTSGRRTTRGAGTFTGRVTHAFAVDIAPVSRTSNVITECVVKCDTSGDCSGGTSGDPRRGYDLKDPIHLYSQAKHLQTLHMNPSRGGLTLNGISSRSRPSSRGTNGGKRGKSLCALWLGYWRSLTHCIVGLTAPRSN